MNERTANKNRWTLIGLAAVFLVPLLAAMYLNSSFSSWRPGATRNYGELIEPVLPLGELEFFQRQRRAARWTLVSLNCQVDCEAHLDELARMRRGLGRHEDKLTVAALDAAVNPPAPLAAIDDPDRLVARALASRSLPAQGLYLVDPLGNLMMRYPPDYTAGAVVDDLERLLKYSKFKPD